MMNIRKTPLVIATILLSLFSFIEIVYASNVCECIEHINHIWPDSLQRHPEDSIMRVLCPELFAKPRFAPPVRQGNFSYSERWHFTRPDTTKQEFLIIAEHSICDTLTNELRTYSEDVHAIYGYGIYLVSVENSYAYPLRELIKSYKENNNKLCGVLLVGDVGEAWYETAHDHGDSYARWPCDLYFMDLDGTWIDSDNDTIFDGHTGNQNPDIFVARLSAVGMSGLGSESTLIRRQLSKSHDFWWKSSFQSSNDTALNYVCEGLSGPSAHSLDSVFPSHNVIDIRYGSLPCPSPADFLSRLNSSNYGFTNLSCHSSTTSHEITTNQPWVQVSEIINNSSGNYAITLNCCYACCWKSSQKVYIGGAHLFNLGKTMAVIGSTKKCSFGNMHLLYNRFPNCNLGMAYLEWWKDSHLEEHCIYDVYGDYGHTLLGDPTINFRHSVGNYCVNDLVLTAFPQDNQSNLVLFRAANSITVSQNFIIPANVHVVFDAPTVTINPQFVCPVGASFEVRNEGSEL